MILWLRYFQCFFQFSQQAHPLADKKRNSKEQNSHDEKSKLKHVSINPFFMAVNIFNVIFTGVKQWVASKSWWCLKHSKKLLPQPQFPFSHFWRFLSHYMKNMTFNHFGFSLNLGQRCLQNSPGYTGSVNKQHAFAPSKAFRGNNRLST